MENKRLEELVERYEKMQAENKIPYLDASDFLDIANYYWDDKKDDEAMGCLSNALKIHPGNEEIIRAQVEIFIDTGELDKARELLNSSTSRSNASLRCLDAELTYEEGDSVAALEILDELFDINTDPDIFMDMAELYEEMDKRDMAIECLEIAVKASPDSLEILLPLISLLSDSGNHTRAVKYLNQYIDIDPYSFIAWIKMADCQMSLKNYDKAIEATEFACIASPDSEAPYLISTQAYFNLGNYQKALEDVSRVQNVNVAPTGFSNFYKGLCHVYLGNFEIANGYLLEALIELDTAERTEDVMYYQVLLHLVKSLYELGRYEEAEKYIKELPMDASDLETVTGLLRAKSMYTPDEAPEDIETLEKQASEDDTAQSWFDLGVGYMDSRRFGDAVNAFCKAISFEPEIQGLAPYYVMACIGGNQTEKIKEHIDFIRKNIKLSHPNFSMEVSEDNFDDFLNLFIEIFDGLYNQQPE